MTSKSKTARVPEGDTRKMAQAPRTPAGRRQFYHSARCWFAARFFERFRRYATHERQCRAEIHRYDRPRFSINLKP